jgi:tRNA pseudouridine38-40 synthase
MARIAAGVEYDGGAYSGWQVQASAPSVQEQLQSALARVADAPVEVICAGRTDAGVHARAQVVHFDTLAVRRERGWVLGTNTHLPADISLRWAHPVPDHFHARYSALSRTYRYFILNRTARSALAFGRAWCVHRLLDEAAMRTAGAALLGEHDFSAFRSSECQARSPVRRLHLLDVQREEDWLRIDVRANAFLHHMVRNIVGLLVAVGCGGVPPQRARELLESRQRARGEVTAPAQGLYFWRAEYPPQFGLPGDSAMIDISGTAPQGP